jgi:tripartite ATP-independent transporter DctP family solute receptor
MILTLLFCALFLASCSGGTQHYAWPLGTSSPDNTVTQLFSEKFAEEVRRLSEGKMNIRVYPNSLVGGDRELLESCKEGDIPFVVQNTAPQVTFMPDIAIFDMPMLFDSIADMRRVVDNPAFIQRINSVYQKGGYELLCYADQGFRVMTTNKRIASIGDFRGQKIRTMENPYHLLFWKGIGANPTPMTFSEVYIGLQQHTIDAQENPYEVVVSNRLYEQQQYVVETNHLPHLISLIVSEKFMSKLSEEQQTIIRQAADIAKAYARQQSDDRIASRINIIKQSGTVVLPLPEETKQEMRRLSEPVRKRIAEKVDSELVYLYNN